MTAPVTPESTMRFVRVWQYLRYIAEDIGTLPLLSFGDVGNRPRKPFLNDRRHHAPRASFASTNSASPANRRDSGALRASPPEEV